jgi:hypothetical protein
LRATLLDLDVDNLDIVERLVTLVRSHMLDLVHNIHSLGDTAKDRVLVVEPIDRHCGDEELAAVGSRTGIRHRQSSRSIMPQRWMELVLEILAPNAGTAGAIAEWIACLDHKAFDDAMEDMAVVVAIARMRNKVLDSLWTSEHSKAQQSTSQHAIGSNSMRHIEYTVRTCQERVPDGYHQRLCV